MIVRFECGVLEIEILLKILSTTIVLYFKEINRMGKKWLTILLLLFLSNVAQASKDSSDDLDELKSLLNKCLIKIENLERKIDFMQNRLDSINSIDTLDLSRKMEIFDQKFEDLLMKTDNSRAIVDEKNLTRAVRPDSFDPVSVESHFNINIYGSRQLLKNKTRAARKIGSDFFLEDIKLSKTDILCNISGTLENTGEEDHGMALFLVKLFDIKKRDIGEQEFLVDIAAKEAKKFHVDISGINCNDIDSYEISFIEQKEHN